MLLRSATHLSARSSGHTLRSRAAVGPSGAYTYSNIDIDATIISTTNANCSGCGVDDCSACIPEHDDNRVFSSRFFVRLISRDRCAYACSLYPAVGGALSEGTLPCPRRTRAGVVNRGDPAPSGRITVPDRVLFWNIVLQRA